MGCQEGQLPGLGMAVFLSLFLHLIHGNHNIPQHQLSGFRIEVILHSLLHMVKIRWRLIIHHRKGQHVRGSVNLTVLPVDFLYGVIVRKNDIDLCLIGTALIIQGSQHSVLDDFPVGQIQYLFCFVFN